MLADSSKLSGVGVLCAYDAAPEADDCNMATASCQSAPIGSIFKI